MLGVLSQFKIVDRTLGSAQKDKRTKGLLCNRHNNSSANHLSRCNDDISGKNSSNSCYTNNNSNSSNGGKQLGGQILY